MTQRPRLEGCLQCYSQSAPANSSWKQVLHSDITLLSFPCLDLQTDHNFGSLQPATTQNMAKATINKTTSKPLRLTFDILFLHGLTQHPGSSLEFWMNHYLVHGVVISLQRWQPVTQVTSEDKVAT